MDVKDKIIIITGASEGIGKAVAEKLTVSGAKVVLAARSVDKLNRLAGQIPGALIVPTDMRKPDDIRHLINETLKQLGRIDILINNAGQGMYGPVESIDIEKYKKIMELNVYAVVRAMQLVIPIMRQQGRSASADSLSKGMILNISSRVSKNYFPYLAAYASTKYALNAISLTARAELEKDHITVSVFHPKMTATGFGKNAIGTSPMAGNRGTRRPAPDVDTPEQVAEQILEQIKTEEPERSM